MSIGVGSTITLLCSIYARPPTAVSFVDIRTHQIDQSFHEAGAESCLQSHIIVCIIHMYVYILCACIIYIYIRACMCARVCAFMYLK